MLGQEKLFCPALVSAVHCAYLRKKYTIFYFCFKFVSAVVNSLYIGASSVGKAKEAWGDLLDSSASAGETSKLIHVMLALKMDV